MTLGDIAQEVAVEYFVREDLTARALKYAHRAYLLMCKKVPFDELQVVTAERAVSESVVEHTIDDLDPALAAILWIRYTDQNDRRRLLRRDSAKNFDAQSALLAGGGPSRYARYGLTLEFDRVAPAADCTYLIRYWRSPTIESIVGETVLECSEEWNELLFWETVYRVYLSLEKHQEAAGLVQPMPMPRQQSPVKTRVFEAGIIPRLWNDLLQTISAREYMDSDFGIYPLR